MTLTTFSDSLSKSAIGAISPFAHWGRIRRAAFLGAAVVLREAQPKLHQGKVVALCPLLHESESRMRCASAGRPQRSLVRSDCEGNRHRAVKVFASTGQSYRPFCFKVVAACPCMTRR